MPLMENEYLKIFKNFSYVARRLLVPVATSSFP